MSNMATLEIRKKEVLELDKGKVMFKNMEAQKCWNDFMLQYSKSERGQAIMLLARRWAIYMQNIIEKEGSSVEKIAQDSLIYCDVEGVTGTMMYYATNVLVCCWKYGESLRGWYNKLFELK